MVTTDEKIAQERTCFDLKAYLKQQKDLVDQALEGSLPITKPEKFMKPCATPYWQEESDYAQFFV